MTIFKAENPNLHANTKSATRADWKANVGLICAFALPAVLAGAGVAEKAEAVPIAFHYTGQPFDNTCDQAAALPPPPGWPKSVCVHGNITTQLTLDSENFPTNYTGTIYGNDPRILSFDASAPSLYLTQFAPADASASYFTFSDGNIVNWEFTIRSGFTSPEDHDGSYITSKNMPGLVWDFVDTIINSPALTETWGMNSDTPGTWATCADIIMGAVSIAVTSNGKMIVAAFTPEGGLANAAKVCGVNNFNWQQKVTKYPDPTGFFSAATGLQLSAPFPDPPEGGIDQAGHLIKCSNGDEFNVFNPDPHGANAFPFYLSPDELSRLTDGDTTLNYNDSPKGACLSGLEWSGPLNSGPYAQFETWLEGESASGTPVDLPIKAFWDWASTVKSLPKKDGGGSVGVIVRLEDALPDNSSDGIGGTAILYAENVTVDTSDTSAVPEPPMYALFVAGGLALLASRRGKPSPATARPKLGAKGDTLCL